MAAAPKGLKLSHPNYLQMITEAISTFRERTGSSQFKIAKFIGQKYKAVLPGYYEKLLLVQLRRLSKSGKLTKVKGSYKLSDELKAAAKAAAKPKPKPSLAAKVAKLTAAKTTNESAKPAVNGPGSPDASAKKVAKPEPKVEKPAISGKAVSALHIPKPVAIQAKKAAAPKKATTPKKAARKTPC